MTISHCTYEIMKIVDKIDPDFQKALASATAAGVQIGLSLATNDNAHLYVIHHCPSGVDPNFSYLTRDEVLQKFNK